MTRRQESRALAAACAMVAFAFAGAAEAQELECSSDAECDGGTCVDAVCRAEVGERVHVPPELGDRYVIETRRYWPVAIAGGSLFVASWIGTIVGAAVVAEDDDQSAAIGQAFVPVVGPFIMQGAGTAPEGLGGDMLIVTGALQGIGLLGAFVGLTVESKLFVPVESQQATITVGPFGQGGLGVTGTF